MLRSNVCHQAQLESEPFRAWTRRIGTPFKLHRKLWEFCYIAQALHERGMLAPGRRGLGFGVGREPLVSLFAGFGCEIVATDLHPHRAERAGWIETNQHAADLGQLNQFGLCDPEAFDRQVSFRHVDMNQIPDELRGFDFVWSSCCLEHLGSIARGASFITNAMECLKPGGVAVHTTEYNVSSNVRTIDNEEDLVLFRRKDIAGIARNLRAHGHNIAVDYTLGNLVADQHVDLPPYSNSYCLRIRWGEFVTTSIGLIVTKSDAERRPSRWNRFTRGLLVLGAVPRTRGSTSR